MNKLAQYRALEKAAYMLGSSGRILSQSTVSPAPQWARDLQVIRHHSKKKVPKFKNLSQAKKWTNKNVHRYFTSLENQLKAIKATSEKGRY